MTARLTFYGGAGTVTGANFLFDIYPVREKPRLDVGAEASPAGEAFSHGVGSKKILIDCGIREREQIYDPFNYEKFPYDPKTIDALIVTHAHADHIGRIPKLVRDGFRGAIHSTSATKELAALMFDDALSVMSKDAAMHGCDVLYEKEDVEQALALWQGREYHEPFDIGDAHAEFLDAGHIVGSAMIKLVRNGRTILFTGDLGNSPEPLLNDTESPEGADYLVIESVYGDRVHEERARRSEHLRAAVEETRRRRGVLLIPSFSIERTQVLLSELNDMVEKGSMEKIPVYLDAPLAIRITEVFRSFARMLNTATRERFARGDDPFSFPGLAVTAGVRESHAIHRTSDPKIIIAGAGMSHGGRVREHEKRYLSDRKATILFVGYQAPGSLGRRIEDGEKRVEIDGHYVNVHARIETLTGYSGHRDRDGLLQFAERAAGTLEKVFVTMGEPKSALFLAQRLRDFLGVESVVPEAGQSFTIEW